MGFFSLHEKCSICNNDIGLNRWQISNKLWICPKCMFRAKEKDKITNILKMTPEEIKKLIEPKITKTYPLINHNENIIRKYLENNNSMLYVYIIIYDNNNKIHIYTEDDEIIGDISKDYIQEIINLGFKSGIIFLKKMINDKTGEIFYTTSDLTCTT